MSSSRKPRIAVLYAPGTNCHEETALAIDLAGGKGIVLPLHDLLARSTTLRNFQGLVLPGGFSYGDHIAGGRVLAVQVVARLRDELREFASRQPILGICNGYQVLMEVGLLPSGPIGQRSGALAQNRSARFESRWVRLLVADTGSFWTDNLVGRILSIPIAHSEGRLTLRPGTQANPAFLYVDDSAHPTEEYPYNPAGSPDGIAGLIDQTGLVLGLMPHPERASLVAQGSTDGLALFTNMVRRCAS